MSIRDHAILLKHIMAGTDLPKLGNAHVQILDGCSELCWQVLLHKGLLEGLKQELQALTAATGLPADLLQSLQDPVG